jgi:hypothetical protein
MYLKGDVKLVRIPDSDWELYDLSEDPTEMDNLADTEPELLQSMIESYNNTRTDIDSMLKKDIRRVSYPYQRSRGSFGTPGGGSGQSAPG